MSVLKNKIYISYRAAFAAWVLGIIVLTVLSLLPPGNEPEFTGLVNDKIRHFTAYAILALIACHAGRNWRERLILCLISFMVSVAIEFLQPFTGRDFEVLDIVANLSGIVAGTGVMAHLLHRRARRETAAGT
jgi:VanZ family protein